MLLLIFLPVVLKEKEVAMYKKIIFLMIFMLLGVSCFFKLDKVDNKGDVQIQLRYAENSTANLSSASRAITVGETIEVILTNILDAREYSAVAVRTQESQEMYFASIPYGVYTVTIRLTKPGATEPYSVITNQLVVGSSVATFTGTIGAPNKISDTDRLGFIYYFDDYAALGLDEEFFYAIFKFNPVSSNLTNPTIDEEELDYIGYYFYLGTSPVLGESDIRIPHAEDGDLYASIGERTYYDRASTNSIFDFMVKDGYAYGIIPKSEFGTFVPGQQYYWKVVAENRIGTTVNKVESSTLPVIMLSSSYKTYQDKIYSPYDEKDFAYATVESDLEFIFFPFPSLHTGSTPYDYRIAISYSSDMSSPFEFDTNSWQGVSSSDVTLESFYTGLTPGLGAGGFDGFMADSTMYWTVRAYSGSTMVEESNIRSFLIGPNLNPVLP